MPDLEFAPQWQNHEPGEFYGEQENAEQLEEHEIDGNGDADEQAHPIKPGGRCKGNHGAALFGRERLRFWLVPAKQGVAQGGPCDSKGALMQIRHVERIGQNEVAVKAHEGAQVERQCHDPGGGGEEEQGLFEIAIGGQMPGEGGEAGQRQFRDDAGGGNA